MCVYIQYLHEGHFILRFKIHSHNRDQDGLLNVMKNHEIIDPDDEDKWKQFLETVLQDFEDKSNPRKN